MPVAHIDIRQVSSRAHGMLPVILLCALTHASTASRLSVTPSVFDFGPVPRNQLLRHAFPYGVSSADTLRIVGTHSPCGCTFAKLPKKVLLPGETGSIEVAYATGEAEGPFEKSFTLRADSKATPIVNLVLKGTVIRDAWTDPPLINLDEAQLGSGWKGDLRIHWLRWKKPKFKIPGRVPGYLTLGKILPDRGDSTLWHLEIGLSPQAVPRHHLDTLALQTADTAWPEIRIPVQGTIADVVVAKPLVVNMGQVKIGQRVSNSFLVVSSAPGAAIASVESTTPFVTARSEQPEEGGKRVRIHLSTAGTPNPGSIGTDILVAVKVAGSRRELKVPVVGRFVK